MLLTMIRQRSSDFPARGRAREPWALMIRGGFEVMMVAVSLSFRHHVCPRRLA